MISMPLYWVEHKLEYLRFNCLRKILVNSSSTTQDQAKNAIKAMLSPRSIVIMGASEQLNKINGRPLKFLLEKGYQGGIYLVNPKYSEIAGVTCYPSLDDIDCIPDLAIIALPATMVCDSIIALGKKGIPAALVFSSGFGEIGPEGKALEAKLLEAARKSGVRICGPNCLGLINAFESVYATFSQYADGETYSGPVGFVSHSGAFGTAIAALARRREIGLGYFVNTGNEIDLGFSEIMQEILLDSRIKVVAGYLEGIKDGVALKKLANLAMKYNKPLVLTKVGRLGAGALAAASHTGSLAVEDGLFDAVARQYGVVRARNEEQMLDILEVMLYTPLPAGNRLGIITQSGGAAVMMADRAEELGLQIPQLTQGTEDALKKIIPGFGAYRNPVDVTGQFVANPAILRDSIKVMLDDPQIDIVVIWLQLMTNHVDLLVNLFSEIRQDVKKPFVVCWVAAPDEAISGLHKNGIAVLRGAEPVVDAVSAFVQYSQARRNWLQEQGQILPEINPKEALSPLAKLHGVVKTISAFELLAGIGVPMAQVKLATTEDEAINIWKLLSEPVVLKIESPDITHKTEANGVYLNLNDEASIRNAFRAIMKSAAEYAPKAVLSGVIVQKMSKGGLELVVGVKRDATFGMMVMVGIGGIMVEVLRDVAWRQAPFSNAVAMQMLDELRMKAIFDGVRGSLPVDKYAIAKLISKVSQFADSVSSRLIELDLNPILMGADGPLAVDCVMVVD